MVALFAVLALFEGVEGWVTDEDGGVVFGEHAVEVGGVLVEAGFRVAPKLEEDLGVGEGGS